MKWHFEIAEIPECSSHPITGYPIYEDGVRGTKKFFTIGQIVNAFTEAEEIITHEDDEHYDEIHSPILPRNTIRHSHSSENDRHRLTMEIPKHKAFIRHDSLPGELYEIGFPRMVVQFRIDKVNGLERPFIMKQTRIFAIKDDNSPITDNTELFQFPFPNVMKNTAVVCWGTNQRLDFKCLSELERAFVWFTSAPFNEDYSMSLLSKSGTFLQYIEKHQSIDFEDELLVPTKRAFTSLFE